MIRRRGECGPRHTFRRAASPAGSLAAPALATDAPKPVTVPLQVTSTDVQVYASAIRLAASLCGADKELACQIGMNEKAELAKLGDAMAALQAAEAKAKK